MKKALQFGAGNIGRGFIGKILSKNDYAVCFADVNTDIINELNLKNEYNVEIVGQNKEIVNVKNVSGVFSNSDDIIEKIKETDLITTAVGANVLKIIAKSLAKGIEERKNAGLTSYLNIIACENMIRGTSFLKSEVEKYVSDDVKAYMNEYIGFPDSAVDRIVPPADEKQNILDVKVEEFREWIVDETLFKGEIPKIVGMELTDNLEAFLERKLFTLNTGHAITAYLGVQKGFSTVKESIEEESIREIVISAMKESGEVLINRYGFDREAHYKYIAKIITRFENPYLRDEVFRVGREPLRKLSFNERLIKPLRGTLEYNLGNDNLVTGIVYALRYRNAEDAQAVELATMIEEIGVKATFDKVSELNNNDIAEKVTNLYNN